MPIYTFPSTIYNGPVINSPFKADEIECTIDPPANGVATWRARLKLLTFAEGGLTAAHASVTLPRSVITPPGAGPVSAPTNVTASGTSQVGNTFTWNFSAVVPVNHTMEFVLDFMPNSTGLALTAAFEVGASNLTDSVQHFHTFTS